MKHIQWIAFSGLLWLAIGTFLLIKGVGYMTDAIITTQSLSFQFQESFGGPQKAAFLLIALALAIGYAKGRFVLSKTVQRVVQGILSLPLPIRPSQVYPKKYWLLIGSMVMLGMVLKIIPMPIDLRGFIDIAIGSALVQGALLYFYLAASLRKHHL